MIDYYTLRRIARFKSSGNEWKIERLAEIAADRVKSRENGTYDTRKFNIVFAAMIIDICIDLVEDGVEYREPASHYGNKIREHFEMKIEDE